MKRRLIAIILCLVMVFGMVSGFTIKSEAIVIADDIIFWAIVSTISLAVTGASVSSMLNRAQEDGVFDVLRDNDWAYVNYAHPFATTVTKLGVEYVKNWIFNDQGIDVGNPPPTITSAYETLVVEGVECYGTTDIDAFINSVDWDSEPTLLHYEQPLVTGALNVNIMTFDDGSYTQWQKSTTGSFYVKMFSPDETQYVKARLHVDAWNLSQSYCDLYKPIVEMKNGRWAIYFYSNYYTYKDNWSLAEADDWYYTGTDKYYSKVINGNAYDDYQDIYLTEGKDYLNESNYAFDFCFNGISTTMPQTNLELEDNDTLIIPDNLLDGVLDAQGNLLEGVGDISDVLSDILTELQVVEAVEDVPIDESTDKFKINSSALLTRFPFSLGADLWAMITIFDVPAVPMVFTFPFDFTSLGLSAYSITADFTGSGDESVLTKTQSGNNTIIRVNIDKYLSWIRFFVLLSWCMFLLLITKNIIK